MYRRRLSLAASLLLLCDIIAFVCAADEEQPTSGPAVSVAAVRQCYQCSSQGSGGGFNPQCPVNSSVEIHQVFRGPCQGLCFTRTNATDPTLVYRGCMDTQWMMPDPLPTEGCYTWTARSQLWCFCSTDDCNGVKLGVAGNQSLEQFVQQEKEKTATEGGNSTNAVLPPTLFTGVLQCWECQSYLNGRNYTQCPLDGPVNVNIVYFSNCTGRCIMHNTLDRSSLLEVMHRGCSSALYGLPDPLPADGCYRWKGEVWCVCSTSGCNGVKLGAPGVRFDAHLRHASNKGHMVQGPAVLLPLILWYPFF